MGNDRESGITMQEALKILSKVDELNGNVQTLIAQSSTNQAQIKALFHDHTRLEKSVTGLEEREREMRSDLNSDFEELKLMIANLTSNDTIQSIYVNIGKNIVGWIFGIIAGVAIMTAGYHLTSKDKVVMARDKELEQKEKVEEDGNDSK